MGNPIGFVLVTYNRPEQTFRLVQRLNEMFGDPPIALHHDFGKSPLDVKALPRNVLVVKQWSDTGWGVIQVVDGNLKALRLLYEHADPDWVVSLSNACYPIKTAEQILTYLAASKADGYMEHLLVRYDSVRDRSDPGTLSRADRWLYNAMERYVGVRLSSYKVMALFGKPHSAIYAKHPAVTSRLTPFRGRFVCYGGEAWYSVRRPAAQALLRETHFSRALRRHYQHRFVPEESYYHTIVCNEPDLRVENFSLTYTDWSNEKSAHPKTLGYEDFPRMLNSDRLFARKFAGDLAMLSALDGEVSFHARRATVSS